MDILMILVLLFSLALQGSQTHSSYMFIDWSHPNISRSKYYIFFIWACENVLVTNRRNEGWPWNCLCRYLKEKYWYEFENYFTTRWINQRIDNSEEVIEFPKSYYEHSFEMSILYNSLKLLIFMKNNSKEKTTKLMGNQKPLYHVRD